MDSSVFCEEEAVETEGDEETRVDDEEEDMYAGFDPSVEDTVSACAKKERNGTSAPRERTTGRTGVFGGAMDPVWIGDSNGVESPERFPSAVTESSYNNIQHIKTNTHNKRYMIDSAKYNVFDIFFSFL